MTECSEPIESLVEVNHMHSERATDSQSSHDGLQVHSRHGHRDLESHSEQIILIDDEMINEIIDEVVADVVGLFSLPPPLPPARRSSLERDNIPEEIEERKTVDVEEDRDASDGFDVTAMDDEPTHEASSRATSLNIERREFIVKCSLASLRELHRKENISPKEQSPVKMKKKRGKKRKRKSKSNSKEEQEVKSQVIDIEEEVSKDQIGCQREEMEIPPSVKVVDDSIVPAHTECVISMVDESEAMNTMEAYLKDPRSKASALGELLDNGFKHGFSGRSLGYLIERATFGNFCENASLLRDHVSCDEKAGEVLTNGFHDAYLIGVECNVFENLPSFALFLGKMWKIVCQRGLTATAEDLKSITNGMETNHSELFIKGSK
eukprot:TRINITY_DN928_c4_g1_i1.p1 TRINITY_DN928_c4_g1~~TRINITY_DN928_c4_g1_i1.p1  ORF type:complete len:379 (+),score=110.50 TRINITY_DN928_c4_g1_i1:129-1265(+)